MAASTHYETLGVERSATPAEVKAAYRRLARVAHPDGGGSTVAFGALHEAYETLSDPQRRASYDEVLRLDEILRSRPAAPPDTAAPGHTPHADSPVGTSTAQPSGPAARRRRRVRVTYRGLTPAALGYLVVAVTAVVAALFLAGAPHWDVPLFGAGVGTDAAGTTARAASVVALAAALSTLAHGLVRHSSHPAATRLRARLGRRMSSRWCTRLGGLVAVAAAAPAYVVVGVLAANYAAIAVAVLVVISLLRD